MCCLILMKEPFMITIDKRSSSIRIKCQNRILNNILLVLIFGSSSQWDVSRDIMMRKDRFIMSTEKCSKRLRLNKLRRLSREMIWKRIWESTKGLELLILISTKFWHFITIGKTLPLIKHFHGASNMIFEMHKIDGWNVVCRSRTKRKGKRKRKITSKQSRILLILSKRETWDSSST